MLVDENHDSAVMWLVSKTLGEYGHRPSARDHKSEHEREHAKPRQGDPVERGKLVLPEPVCRERLSSCLRDATGPSGALVARMLPGIFSEGAPRDIREEQSIIMSEFHPVGFRLMSISSAETDTRDLLPRIQVPTLLLWGDTIVAVRCMSQGNCTPPFPAPSLRSSRRLDISVTWSNRKSSMYTFVASV